MDSKLSLPAFLKMLSNNDVPMSKAMAVASKIYKEFNTPASLAQLDDAKLKAFALDDKELRKSVLAAIRKAGPTTTCKTETVVAGASPSSSRSLHAVVCRCFCEDYSEPRDRPRRHPSRRSADVTMSSMTVFPKPHQMKHRLLGASISGRS